MNVAYRRVQVGVADVFYREAGAPVAPVLLLLHGFPSSSHMFRDLILALAGDYRVIAPDMPGFGLTTTPARGLFDYSFEALTDTIEGFVEALGVTRYSLYIFDYGAPVGLRLALRHPDRVQSIITQNGNAYVEGLSDEWGPWQAYWREESQVHRDACRASLGAEAIRSQYLHGAPAATVGPDGYTLDLHYMDRDGAREIQLDLILDYRTNVALYPEFQRYLREHKPPLLAAWGKHDTAFLAAGAEAYRRDVPDAEIHLLDGGHFVLESHHTEVANLIRDFLGRRVCDVEVSD